jgi:O-antigen ligase
MKRKLSIKLSDIPICFYVASVFLPGMLNYTGGYGVIENISKVIVYLGIAVIFLHYFPRSKTRWNLFYTSLFLCFGIMMISTIINTGNFYSLREAVAPALLKIFAFLLFINYGKEKGRLHNYISCMSNVFSIFIIINIVGQIVFPNGFYQTLAAEGGYWQDWASIYFLGNDNTFCIQYLFYLAIIVLNSVLKNNHVNIWGIVMILLCDLSVVIAWTASGIVGCLVLTIALFIYRSKTLSTFVLKHYKTWLFAIVVFFVVVVCLQATDWVSFITGALHKDITLSGRTIIWAQYMPVIAENPLLGYGTSNSAMITFSGMQRSCHNQYLQIMLYGGVLALIAYVSMIWVSVKTIHRLKINAATLIVFAAVLLQTFVLMIEQNVFNIRIYVLLYVLYLLPYYFGKEETG